MKKTLIMFILSGLILSACSREETTDDIDQKAVDRWQALINDDFAAAYAYLAPSFRDLETLRTYENRMAAAKLSVNWQDARYVSKQCDEDVCQVNMETTYIYRFPKRSMGEAKLTTSVQENWIKSNGKWYYMPEEKKKI